MATATPDCLSVGIGGSTATADVLRDLAKGTQPQSTVDGGSLIASRPV
jgi:hypothetical protein